MDVYVFSWVFTLLLHHSFVEGTPASCDQGSFVAICDCVQGGRSQECVSYSSHGRDGYICDGWCSAQPNRCFHTQIPATCSCTSCVGAVPPSCSPIFLPKFCPMNLDRTTSDSPSTTVKSSTIATVIGSSLTPSAVIGSSLTPSAVIGSSVTPSAVVGSSLSPSAVSGSSLTPSAVSGSSLTPSAVTGSSMTPSAVIGSSMTPSAVIGSSVTPSAGIGSSLTPSPAIGSTTGTTLIGSSTETVTKVTATAESPTFPTVTPNNSVEVAEMLTNLTGNPENIGPEELDDVIDVLFDLTELGSNDINLTASIIETVSNIMDINTTTLGKVPETAKVPRLLEEQLSHVQANPGNFSGVQENVAVEAVKLGKSSFKKHGARFKDPFRDDEAQDGESRSSSIELPTTILDVVLEVAPDIVEVPLTFIAFRSAAIFPTPDESGEVISNVISAKVDLADVEIKDLTSPVVVTFGTKEAGKKQDDKETVCVFWKYTDPEYVRGEWDTEGCTTMVETDTVTCHCNHLTSFAVLVRGKSGSFQAFYHRALSTITTVDGCISIVGLFLCLLLMLLVRSVRAKQETRVHINLCVSLLGLYLTFVIGIERTGNPVACQIIAAIIHLFCLASVAWMSVEAFIIYKLIYKYQRSNTKRLVTLSMVSVWGMSALAAILVFFLDKSHDYASEPDFCFLHQGPGFYFGFLLPAFLLTVYNCSVFSLATYRMYCRSINAVDDRAKRRELFQRVYSTALFWVLLGLSWIFGFLSAFENPTSVVFQLLFCVFLSLQGLFLFNFLIVQNPLLKAKMIKLVSERSTRSYGLSTSKGSQSLALADKPPPAGVGQ